MMLAFRTPVEIVQAASTPALFGAAVGGAVVWYLSHVLVRRRAEKRRWQAVALAVRTAVGFGALMLAVTAIRRVLVLATNWPLWPIALAGALLVELSLSLYRVERGVVRPSVRRSIGALRVALALLVVFMLMQPVFLRENREEFKRTVAVLVDDSGSMGAADTQLSVTERLRLAEAFADRPIRRPHRLEDAAAAVDDVHKQVSVQADWLRMLGGLEPDVQSEHLSSRRKDLNDVLSKAADTLKAQQAALDSALQDPAVTDKDTRSALSDLRQRFADDALKPIQDAVTMTDKSHSEDLEARQADLLERVSSADAALVRLEPDFQDIGRRLDQEFYSSLSDEDRAAVDSFAHITREDLARAVLLHRPAPPDASSPAPPDLLQRLQSQYNLRLYVFASQPTEVSPDEWQNDPKKVQPQGTGETDMTAALEEVKKQVSPEQLAGIVLLTDGQQNTPDRPEAPARELGMSEVPICPIVIGGKEPPRDAAVVSVVAPEVVHAKDTMYVTVELKLDGLKGKTAQVKLMRDDEETPVDTKDVPIPDAEYRKRIELSDTPKDAGLHTYHVSITPFDGEAFTSNNSYPLTLNVTEELTQLLIIAGRPRWEFRYLKNLFESRDVSVKLQYVLLNPDRIGGTAPLPQVAASASRPREEPQATLLPQSEQEWMKFDVIILGDVSPDALSDADYDALRRFVTDRGGTLVVIAGPDYMPHAFTDTPLADLLPVEVTPSSSPVAAPEESYHIALTPEGQDSVIMRQAVDPDENLRIWKSLPPIYWRHPVLDTKPGATVLAYAVPDAGAGAGVTPQEQQTEQYQRSHALIALQQVALGNVLMLDFDRTWRMRYQHGDTLHHKFWGQVMRWATAGKLPAGTDLIKLGTDKSRYAPHADVSVRAKLLQPDLSPLANAAAAVNVYQGTKLVLRRNMTYLAGSPGIYTADLGQLPAGAYRAELDCPAAVPILASENAKTVSTEFAVAGSTSAELVDLDPDRALLARLADLSGGRTLEPAQSGQLKDVLRANVFTRSKKFEYVLWNSWPFLAIIMIVGASEWLIRRRSGLP